MMFFLLRSFGVCNLQTINASVGYKFHQRKVFDLHCNIGRLGIFPSKGRAASAAEMKLLSRFLVEPGRFVLAQPDMARPEGVEQANPPVHGLHQEAVLRGGEALQNLQSSTQKWRRDDHENSGAINNLRFGNVFEPRPCAAIWKSGAG
tara:strand:+ start:248 stop:691 length:444 start_codon:yes stop_codon:yes gene_type:complete